MSDTALSPPILRRTFREFEKTAHYGYPAGVLPLLYTPPVHPGYTPALQSACPDYGQRCARKSAPAMDLELGSVHM